MQCVECHRTALGDRYTDSYLCEKLEIMSLVFILIFCFPILTNTVKLFKKNEGAFSFTNGKLEQVRFLSKASEKVLKAIQGISKSRG